LIRNQFLGILEVIRGSTNNRGRQRVRYPRSSLLSFACFAERSQAVTSQSLRFLPSNVASNVKNHSQKPVQSHLSTSRSSSVRLHAPF
jgi:hypothetical protein